MPPRYIGILTLGQDQIGYIVLVPLYIGKNIILYSHTSVRKTGFDFIIMYSTNVVNFLPPGIGVLTQGRGQNGHNVLKHFKCLKTFLPLLTLNRN